MKQQSVVHKRFGRGKPPFQLKSDSIDNQTLGILGNIGVHLTPEYQDGVRKAMGAQDVMDSFSIGQPTMTAPGIMAPVQFLQAILPGIVKVATAARKIDDLIGMSTVASWEDEEVLQLILEPTGKARPYSDSGMVPLASWNVNLEKRTITRFELGFSVASLEMKRSQRITVDSATAKRGSVTEALEILRNRIGFFGYNDGTNRTFGFLNDPNLPAYETLPAGSSGSTQWTRKSFEEITADIRLLASMLRTNTKERVDPEKDRIVMAIATSAKDALNTMNQPTTITVKEWLRQNYPTWSIESAPELDNANGGASVVYVYPERVNDGSTDDGLVFDQLVVTKLIALGAETRMKAHVEDFSNATAGTLCKRPMAVIRASGV
jgi:hypothetical protein